MKWIKRYLYSEVGIEFKACLYFSIILFFYFLYRIIEGSFYASILTMTEMVFTAYIIGYIQVYLLGNFDESEHLGIKEMIYSVGCSVLYVLVSYVGKWFDRDVKVSIFFFLYVILCYACVFLCYRIKRAADTERLNKELDAFKSQKKNLSDEGEV